MNCATPPPAGQATLHSFFLDGPAGRLEALLDPGTSHSPGAAHSPLSLARCAVVLAHPHPLGGGSMHNKVIYHAARVFRDLGWPTLRFNFRGVGLSQGVHDGQAERADLTAALDWLRGEFDLPILAAGFSFGAAITLATAPARNDLRACLALGLPLHSPNQTYSYPQLAGWRLPVLFLSGERDVFASPEELAAAVQPAAAHAELQILPHADHFFTGHLAAMQDAIRAWLNRHIQPLPDSSVIPASKTADAE